MDSQDTVAAVMAEVQMLRERDRETGQDSRWHGLDAIPNAANEALEKHDGYITHQVVSFHRSTRADKKGHARNYVSGIVTFSIHGSQPGKPVTLEVSAEAWDRGDPIPTMMKVALRTFLQQILLLPTDRAEPHLYPHGFGIVPPTVSELKAEIAGHFKGKPMSFTNAAIKAHTGKEGDWSLDDLSGFLRALEGIQGSDTGTHSHALGLYPVKAPRLPKLKNAKTDTHLPFFGDLLHVRAKKAGKTLDQYAILTARNYLDSLRLRQEPFFRLDLIKALLFEGFSEFEADYGVFLALMGSGIHGNSTGDLSASPE
jgi:hypothetical protein